MEKSLSDQISDTPGNVLRALIMTPPRGKDDWDYLKEGQDDN